MSGILLSTDLMFGSKVRSAAKAAGYDLKMLGSCNAALESLQATDAKLVILDLTTAGLKIEEFMTQLQSADSAPAIVAFAPHVMTDRIENARAAGCDLVLTRGQFDRSIGALLDEYLA